MGPRGKKSSAGEDDRLMAMLGRGITGYMSREGASGGSGGDEDDDQVAIESKLEFASHHKYLDKQTIKQLSYLLQNVSGPGMPLRREEVEALGAATQKILNMARGPKLKMVNVDPTSRPTNHSAPKHLLFLLFVQKPNELQLTAGCVRARVAGRLKATTAT